MYQKIEPIFLRNITPMHVGVGSDLGIVDLPIQREKHTGYPKIESSGIKGCVREYFEATAKNPSDVIDVHILFGYDDKSVNQYKDENGEIKRVNDKVIQCFAESKGKFAGAVGFSDAKILFFPVKSAKGVFAHVTCVGVLKKFAESLSLCKEVDDELKEVNNELVIKMNELKEPDNEKVYCNMSKLVLNNKVVLDEYVYEVDKSVEVNQIFTELCGMIGLSTDRADHMVVINDDEFADFVNMYTEVITRTKISNISGTVEDGALFNEEYLPAETIMYSLLLESVPFYQEEKEMRELSHVTKKIDEKFQINGEKTIVLQIGSGATIGKGIVKMKKGF